MAIASASQKSSSAPRTKKQSLSSKTGLFLSVSRIKSYLKANSNFRAISEQAAVFLTAAVEASLLKTMHSSAKASKRSGKKCVLPLHISMAARKSKSLNVALAKMRVLGCVPLPKANTVLMTLDEKAAAKKKKALKMEKTPAPSQ
jgi:histone H3/H4